jgi:hypothetical protein
VSAPSRRVLLLLAVLAVLELATLGVLLVNLFTVHARPITQAMGPIHGAVYTTIVVIMIFAPGFRVADRILGCIPVVGGAIALARGRRLVRRSGERG